MERAAVHKVPIDSSHEQRDACFACVVMFKAVTEEQYVNRLKMTAGGGSAAVEYNVFTTGA